MSSVQQRFLFSMLLAVAAFSSTMWASQADLYLAAAAAGANDGSSCANAEAYTMFNSPGNWGPGSAQIGPGTTVHLCGTIGASAGSTPLTFQGGGSSANPVTVLFEPGASIQEPYFGNNGAINMNGQTYVTINGGTNGLIQATANGTPGANNCPAGACSNQNNSNGVEGMASNDIVENLTIADMYVRSGTTDEVANSLNMDCMDVGSNGNAYSNMTITGNQMHDCGAGIMFQYGTSGGSNFIISNNTIYNVNWGIGSAGYSGVNYDSIYIFGNKIYGYSNWDDTVNDDFHHNAMHFFQGNNSASMISRLFIYNNEMDGPVGDCCVTAQIYIDNNGGNTLFTSSFVFNNVFSYANGDCTQTCGNGLLGVFSGPAWGVFNNTFIGNATNASVPQGYLVESNQPGATLAFMNNLLTAGVTEAYFNIGSLINGSPDYNVYSDAQAGGQVFQCQNLQLGALQFSAWMACTENETHSLYVPASPVPNCNSNTDCSNVKPPLGSPVIQAGANLSSLCVGQPNPGLGALCYDKSGNPRPLIGNWDVGAFSYTGSSTSPVLPTAPLAPTGLTAIVH